MSGSFVSPRPLTCKAALQALLDAMDYTSGACSLTEMVGAVVDKILIDNAREAIANEK